MPVYNERTRPNFDRAKAPVEGPVDHVNATPVADRLGIPAGLAGHPEAEVKPEIFFDASEQPPYENPERDEFHDASDYVISDDALAKKLDQLKRQEKTNPKKITESVREQGKSLWEKRIKQIDAKQINSWSADLKKLANTEPAIQALMAGEKFKAELAKLMDKVADKTYANVKAALESGKFSTVKALFDNKIYTDYIREPTWLGGVLGQGKLKGAPAPVSPDVSEAHAQGEYQKDTEKVTGSKWARASSINETKQALDLASIKEDAITKELLTSTSTIMTAAEAVADALNKGKLGELSQAALSGENKTLAEAMGGETIFRQVELLEGQKTYLGAQVAALEAQNKGINVRIEELGAIFLAMNSQREREMGTSSEEPDAYLNRLASEVKAALQHRPQDLAKNLDKIKDYPDADARAVSTRVLEFHGGLGSGENLISLNHEVANKKQIDLKQYIADLNILSNHKEVSSAVKSSLTTERDLSIKALNSLEKYNKSVFISDMTDNVRNSKQSLEDQSNKIAKTISTLQNAANLVERMVSVIKAKGFTERARSLNADLLKFKQELKLLKDIDTDDSKVRNKGYDGFTVSQVSANRVARIAALEAEIVAQGEQIKSANTLFNNELAKIKILDADPKKPLPQDGWGQKIWDFVVNGTGLPAGERLGREDTGTLVREKLMADKGITLKQSYTALLAKLGKGKTVAGAAELIKSLGTLPAWAYKNPQLAKELIGDLTHAIAILQQGPEVGAYKGTLDNIVSCLKAEGIASDLLVGNRTEYEDRDVPPEVFALLHMAQIAPYVAGGVKAGTAGTLAGNTVRAAVSSLMGAGMVSGLLGSLADVAQGAVKTSVEKNVARALPTGTDALVTAAQQLYRGDSTKDVAQRYAAREVVKEIAGHAREIYEEGWGTWAKNILTLKNLRDLWRNSGVGEKIYRVVTEGVVPLAGALAVGFFLGGPIGLALALVIGLGGTFLVGRFNDRVTPFVTNTQAKIRKQRSAEKAKKYLLTNDQYGKHIQNASGNIAVVPEFLKRETAEYLAEKIALVASNNGGSLKKLTPVQIEEQLKTQIEIDDKADVAKRVAVYMKEKTDKKEPLRDSEQADLTKVVGELDQTLFGSRAAPADTAGSGDPVQPQWTEKTKTAIKPNN